MTGLTITISQAIDERITDPERWHPRHRGADEIAAAFPEPSRPQRLVHDHKGQTFRPHGTDSVGVIVSHPRSRRSVQFFYEHDRDTLHSLQSHEFTDRFAQLHAPRRRPAGVRHVRSTPSAAIEHLREAA